jgi:hypothetical protein
VERTYIDAEGRRQPDRRQDRQLRCIFQDACEVIAPFIDKGNNWGGQSLASLAFRAVRDRFPELPAESVRVLIQACVRRSRRHEAATAIE